MSERLNEIIRNELRKRELSERAASERAGLSSGTLNYILKHPSHTPAKESVKKIARFFGWPEIQVLEMAGYKTGPETPVAPPTPDELIDRLRAELPVAIPIVDQIVHAGGAAIAMGYTYLPPALARGKRLIATTVKGDCMEPTISEGETIIIDLEGSPVPGDVVVVLVNHEEVEIKRFARKLNETVVLSCDNPAYPDIEAEDMKIQGVVIQATKKLKGQ